MQNRSLLLAFASIGGIPVPISIFTMASTPKFPKINGFFTAGQL